jgi:hypothetical protein
VIGEDRYAILVCGDAPEALVPRRMSGRLVPEDWGNPPQPGKQGVRKTILERPRIGQVRLGHNLPHLLLSDVGINIVAYDEIEEFLRYRRPERHVFHHCLVLDVNR